MQRYTEGDLQAKHILIERNLRLVAHVIKKYQSVNDDPEDLISIGTIGLIKAIMTFNSEKGNRLAAYASRCIDNDLKENIKKLYTKMEHELSPRERLVLKMRYGLYGQEEYTQREIAHQLSISRSYVSRIEKSAVEKLRPFFCSS